MNRVAFLIVAICLCVVGCSDPARPHLELLVSAWGRVLGTQFPDLENYEGDERKIRFLRANSTATYKMLTDYLSVDRPITPELKQFLADWQAVSKQSMDLHNAMIDEKRYTYNDDEKELAERLIKGESIAGIELLDHLKGY